MVAERNRVQRSRDMKPKPQITNQPKMVTEHNRVQRSRDMKPKPQIKKPTDY